MFGSPANVAKPKIELTVIHQGKTQKFALKRTATLERVFTAFAETMGVPRATLRFNFEGVTLRGDETPESLELDDNDVIDAHLMQVGGAIHMPWRRSAGAEASYTMLFC